jgi:DNA-binding NarL/FixJ family response regulator
MKRITILVVEDHKIVREGFHRILTLKDDFEVVGEAQDGRQAVVLAKKLHPAVVLMDISLPQFNGLEATRQILKAVPATKVLILSAHDDDAYVKSGIDSGAAGFLLKQTSADEVCQAIREVQKGKVFFSPAVSMRLNRLNLQPSSHFGRFDKKVTHLTSREMEVLQLIAEGEANKQIAADLGISIKTVEKHRDHLMQKLDIHDTAGLTRYAISAGIVESSVHLTAA